MFRSLHLSSVREAAEGEAYSGGKRLCAASFVFLLLNKCSLRCQIGLVTISYWYHTCMTPRAIDVIRPKAKNWSRECEKEETKELSRSRAGGPEISPCGSLCCPAHFGKSAQRTIPPRPPDCTKRFHRRGEFGRSMVHESVAFGAKSLMKSVSRDSGTMEQTMALN